MGLREDIRNPFSTGLKRLQRRLTVGRREPGGPVDAGGEGVDETDSPPQPEPYTPTKGGHDRSRSRNDADADGERVDPPAPSPRSGGSGQYVLRSNRGGDGREREAVTEGKKPSRRDLHLSSDIDQDPAEGGPSRKGTQVDPLISRPRSTSSISHGAASKSTEIARYFNRCF